MDAASARGMRDPDQLWRLAEFRARHPEVIIGTLGFGAIWQARITQPAGETVFTRYLLRNLLDRLDEHFPPDPQDSG